MVRQYETILRICLQLHFQTMRTDSMQLYLLRANLAEQRNHVPILIEEIHQDTMSPTCRVILRHTQV